MQRYVFLLNGGIAVRPGGREAIDKIKFVGYLPTDERMLFAGRLLLLDLRRVD
jgi:hypothetical protein